MDIVELAHQVQKVCCHSIFFKYKILSGAIKPLTLTLWIGQQLQYIKYAYAIHKQLKLLTDS